MLQTDTVNVTCNVNPGEQRSVILEFSKQLTMPYLHSRLSSLLQHIYKQKKTMPIGKHYVRSGCVKIEVVIHGSRCSVLFPPPVISQELVGLFHVCHEVSINQNGFSCCTEAFLVCLPCSYVCQL